jgi:hypothetical protein
MSELHVFSSYSLAPTIFSDMEIFILVYRNYNAVKTRRYSCPCAVFIELSTTPWRLMRSGGIPPPFFTSALDGGVWSASRPDQITPWEGAPGTYWIWNWVGPRAGLDSAVKRKMSWPCLSSPRSVAIPTELRRLLQYYIRGPRHRI